jgi:hypothetical protein
MTDIQIIEERKELATAEIIYIARQVLKPTDFAKIKTKIGEIVEIKRDGILNLLSSLPVGYNFRIIEREITEDYALVRVELEVIFPNGIIRRGEGVGVCERSELKGIDNLHNLLTKAETRAMKRATEVCLGAVINTVIKEFFEKQPSKTIDEVIK